MITENKHELELAAPPRGGEKELEWTRAALVEHAQERAADHRTRTSHMIAAREEERRAVAEIFDGKLETFKKECAAWRVANGLDRLDLDTAPAEVRRGLAARARSHGQAALRRLGIDAAHLETVRKHAHATIDALAPASPAGAPELKFLPEQQVPLKIRNHNTSPWVLRKPPYDGWSWWFSESYRGGSAPTSEGYLDSSTGDVGHRSQWKVDASADDDFFYRNHAHHVAIWHWVDAPGPVEVWVKVRCATTRSYMFLAEEYWQWSSANVAHRDYLSINVSPSNADANLSATWYATCDVVQDDFVQDLYPVPSNNVYWVNMVTTQPVAAGQWAFIQVGSRGNHHAIINDTFTRVILQSRWFIEEFYYRIL
jgi:hypothetical protein